MINLTKLVYKVLKFVPKFMFKFERNQACVLAFVAQFLFLSLEVIAEKYCGTKERNCGTIGTNHGTMLRDLDSI